MKKLIINTVLLIGVASYALGATPAAFNLNPVSPLPYQYTPLTPGQHNVAPTTATVKYTTDGTTTPTSTVGQSLPAGACVSLSGPLVIANFSAFSSTGTLDIEYFR
jgi:hypothetical protein